MSKALPKDTVDLTWQDGEVVTRVLGTLDVSLHYPSPGEAFGGVCAIYILNISMSLQLYAVS